MKLPFDLDRALEGLSKVTLRGGVVGKVAITIIVVALVIGVIAWSVRNIWISAVGMVLIFALAFPMLWRLINFADRHPQAALLEGAEFLVHQQILHATKHSPALQVNVVPAVEPEPVEGPAADPALAQIPDEQAAPPNPEGHD